MFFDMTNNEVSSYMSVNISDWRPDCKKFYKNEILNENTWSTVIIPAP